jgi:hypothetical protein
MDDTELDRALKSALSVSPSPEFVARVRQRIVEREPNPIFGGWLKPAVLAMAVGVLMIITTFKASPTEPVTTIPTIASSGIVDIAEAPTIHFTSVTSPRIAALTNPERPTTLTQVVVAADDVRAFREFVASARERRFEIAFDDTPSVTSWMTTELTVEPLTIEPLLEPAAINN